MKQRPTFPARIPSEGSPHSAVSRERLAAEVSRNLGLKSPKGASGVRGAVIAAEARPLGVGMDSAAVRLRMVQLLQKQGVQDRVVLAAMEAVERHRFVDSALVNQAYEDTSLPIGLGQTISKPGVVSRMIELLRNGREGVLGRVLEVGTGCGYQAAVLSRLCAEVYSIERLRGLYEKAQDNLRPLRIPNIHLIFGDGMQGFARGAPYAGIIAAAGGEAVPQAWIDQLAVGGRLVAPVQTGGARGAGQALLVLDKTPQGVRQTMLEAVHFVPLKSGVA